MNKKMKSTLTVKMNDELYDQVKAEANRRGISVSELARQYIFKGLSVQGAYEGLDVIQEVVSNTIKNSLRRTEDRMAKLSAKSAIASATSMYMNTDLIHTLGYKDAVERYQKSRKKAIEYVRRPEE